MVRRMNAEEMFEKLGFIQGYDLKDVISYRLFCKHKLYCKHELMVEITFLIPDKRYFITRNKKYFDNSLIVFEPKIHKAIHKQLEELGWLE